MLKRSKAIRRRRVLDLALDYMEDDPVLLLEGPRSVGKSTLLGEIATEIGADVVDLDAPEVRSVVESDPGVYVPKGSKVCVDEYQKAPIILDAIKSELNRETIPGQYVLTGSTRYDSLPPAAQALTGRLTSLPVFPLSQGEIDGTDERIVERLFDDPGNVVAEHSVSSTEKGEYVERMVAGGMPLAFTRASGTARNRWFDNYLRLTLQRDVRELSNVQQNGQIERLLHRLSGQTAQMLNIQKAASDAGLTHSTAERYIHLLEAVFLVYRLPAWGKTLRARVNKLPKIHVLDSGVAARLMRLTPQKLKGNDPTVMAEFGHLLETFVVGELLKQASWIPDIGSVGHWRTRDKDEVDLILEHDDGSVLGFEVKAAGRIVSKDLRGLLKLRGALNQKFTGIVLYTGEKAYKLGDDIYAIPIDALWLA